MATTNYSWTLPTPGGSSGSWGNDLNTIFNDLDTELYDAEQVALAALDRAGGTMTGKLINKVAEYVDTTFTGSGNVDLDVAQCYVITVSGATTLTFQGSPTSGNWMFFVIELINGGSASVSFQGGTFKWPGGTQPTFTTSGTDIITGYTRDAGTTFHLVLAGEDVS
jgi:hypothetical protein